MFKGMYKNVLLSAERKNCLLATFEALLLYIYKAVLYTKTSKKCLFCFNKKGSDSLVLIS